MPVFVVDDWTLRVWKYLHEYIAAHGFAPSQREASSDLFMSIPAVVRRYSLLAGMGILEFQDGTARSVSVRVPYDDRLAMPIGRKGGVERYEVRVWARE